MDNLGEQGMKESTPSSIRRIYFHPRDFRDTEIIEGKEYVVQSSGGNAHIIIERPGKPKIAFPLDTYFNDLKAGDTVVFKDATKLEP